MKRIQMVVNTIVLTPSLATSALAILDIAWQMIVMDVMVTNYDGGVGGGGGRDICCSRKVGICQFVGTVSDKQKPSLICLPDKQFCYVRTLDSECNQQD